MIISSTFNVISYTQFIAEEYFLPPELGNSFLLYLNLFSWNLKVPRSVSRDILQVSVSVSKFNFIGIYIHEYIRWNSYQLTFFYMFGSSTT